MISIAPQKPRRGSSAMAEKRTQARTCPIIANIYAQCRLRADVFFRLFLPNGFGTALFGTEIIFFAASRKRSHASVPSIMSAVPVFMASVYQSTVGFMGVPLKPLLRSTVDRRGTLHFLQFSIRFFLLRTPLTTGATSTLSRDFSSLSTCFNNSGS